MYHFIQYMFVCTVLCMIHDVVVIIIIAEKQEASNFKQDQYELNEAYETEPITLAITIMEMGGVSLTDPKRVKSYLKHSFQSAKETNVSGQHSSQRVEGSEGLYL